MKIKYVSLSLLLPILVFSCQAKEINGAEDFKKEFEKRHPEGLHLSKGWYEFSIVESKENVAGKSFYSKLSTLSCLLDPIDSSIYKSNIDKLSLYSKEMKDDGFDESTLSFSDGKAFGKIENYDLNFSLTASSSYFGAFKNLKILTSLTDYYNNIDLSSGKDTDNHKNAINASYYVEGKTKQYYLETAETFNDNETSWTRKETFYFDLNYEWQSQNYYYEKTTKDGSYSSLRISLRAIENVTITVPDSTNEDKPLDSIDLDFTEEKIAI